MDLSAIQDKLASMPQHEKERMLELLGELEEAKSKEKALTGFLDFVRMMWPSFIAGEHHQVMANAFERVARGELKRQTIKGTQAIC
jgi:hypothetical protein